VRHNPTPPTRIGRVVDAERRVASVDNLHVVEASILAEVPSANTTLPTMMAAERVAELLSSLKSVDYRATASRAPEPER
jgi:choline dehydrogenase